MSSIRGPNIPFISQTQMSSIPSPHVPIVGDGQENSAIKSTTSA